MFPLYLYDIFSVQGLVAQMVERSVCIREVKGSMPFWSIFLCSHASVLPKFERKKKVYCTNSQSQSVRRLRSVLMVNEIEITNEKNNYRPPLTIRFLRPGFSCSAPYHWKLSFGGFGGGTWGK